MLQKHSLGAWLRRLMFGRPAVGGLPAALSLEQEAYVLAHAYVPEHIPSLMTGISGAQPVLIQDHLCFARDDWLIFVGYPLDGSFAIGRSTSALAHARAAYRPRVLWFIGPEIPPELATVCHDRLSDSYYRLDLAATIGAAAQRAARAAAATLVVDAGCAFTVEHVALTDELMARGPLPPMVAALYRAMPDYLASSCSATILDARDTAGRLAAFYVIEQASPVFDTYVLGAYSRRAYVSHASDLLCATMIDLARARGKSWINLGLGVNAGIRRFKEKWGGVPVLAYEFCECRTGTSSPMVDLLMEWKL